MSERIHVTGENGDEFEGTFFGDGDLFAPRHYMKYFRLPWTFKPHLICACGWRTRTFRIVREMDRHLRENKATS